MIGFVLGLVVIAAAAALWPLPTEPRTRSLISVQPDGGRQEDFLIRWPEDRVRLTDGIPTDLPPLAVPGVQVLENTAGQRASAEVFRLRDAEDNVIGVAARLAGTGSAVADPGRATSNWLLVIPSRGAVMLAQSDAFDSTARPAAGPDGVYLTAPSQSTAFWGAGPRIVTTVTAPRNTGRILGGTEEFDGLAGSYTEAWELDESAADGSTRGRILLSTFLAEEP